MKDSELRTRAKLLALKIISVCDTIDTKKGRGVLVNQITRSATSIGANIHEANYASNFKLTNWLILFSRVKGARNDKRDLFV